MSKKVDDEGLFYDEDIQSPPQNVYRSEPNEVGAEAVDSQVNPRNVTSQRRSRDALAPTRPGAFREGGLGNEQGQEEDERTIQIGDEEQATVATGEEWTIDIVARVVDTEEENQRLREQDLMRPELDHLRQMADNEDEDDDDDDDDDADDDDDDNDGDLPKRWFASSAIFLIVVTVFLIVVAVTVTLALVLPSEPTTPVPSAPGPTTPETLNNLLSSLSSDGGEALRIPSTPQNKAVAWLADDTNLVTYSSETIIQRYALATLYYSTNGDSWDSNEFWLDSGEECGRWQTNSLYESAWLLCTDTGAASQLHLSYNNLRGTLPPEIGLLTSLGECILVIDCHNALTRSLWASIRIHLVILMVCLDSLCSCSISF
jgi:hypothetical protein